MAEPEPWPTIMSEVNGQDVAGLIERVPSPALLVLCDEFNGGRELQDQVAVAIERRRELAAYVAQQRPDLNVAWLATGHMLFHSMPGPTAELINRFLESRRPEWHRP